jgi:rubrerythrin
MRVQPDERNIVCLLAEHEHTLARLYRAYAGRFPEHQAFWSRLAEEEDQHAKWLQRLLIRVEEGLGCVRAERFERSAVEESTQRIVQMIKEAANPEFSMADALQTAMTLEQASLEAEYFEVFEGTAAEIVQVQYCLADALIDHRRRIYEMMSPPK